MSEPFAAVEEMVRSLAEDVNPAVSLRQRILTASHIARERQLSRIRFRRTSCWFLLCLCMVCAGTQVHWSDFQSPGGHHDGELSAARDRAVKDSQSFMGYAVSVIVSQTEASSPVFSDSIEWETAESQWKRRDRQSTLISHYF